MIAWVGPAVEELTAERCVVCIPLKRRNKNHVGSMYLGTLSVGADVAGGLLAMELVRKQGGKVTPLFKAMQAEYLARAEGDVLFTCEDGSKIALAVDRALETGARQNIPVHVVATVPKKLGDKPVARFTLTLSIKRDGSKRNGEVAG
jgi:acyl-coenzyme A thioesterase PaaI-like protein